MAVAFGLLVGVVVAALPIDMASWIRPSDYPTTALLKNRGGISRYQLVISPDGHPRACEIEQSSGYSDLDSATCRALLEHAKFRPAQNAAGKPILSLFRGRAVWTIPGVTSPLIPSYEGDLLLTIDRFPKSVERPIIVGITFSVDEKGEASDCSRLEPDYSPFEGFPSSTPDGGATKALVSAACTEYLKRTKVQPFHSVNGNVASVRMAFVKFTVDGR